MTNKQDTELLGAYLIVGEDELKRQHVLERLRARLAKMGDLEFNHDELNGETATGSAIASACNTLPFASDIRFVEVKNGQELKKEDAEVLIAYLAAPNPSTVLAFSADKLAKNTRLYKAFEALGPKAIIDCTPMAAKDLPSAVRNMAKAYGLSLNDAAARKLVEYLGESTVRLDGELKRLSLMADGSGALSAEDIEELVSRTNEAKPWDLIDAFCDRNTKECLRLLTVVENAPLKLLALAVKRLRELTCAKALVARGESSQLGAALGLQAWQVKKLPGWANNFSTEELQRAYSLARDCERSLKSGGGQNALADWFIEVTRRS